LLVLSDLVSFAQDKDVSVCGCTQCALDVHMKEKWTLKVSKVV